MADLRRTRHTLRTVLIVLLLVDVAAAVFLLTPLGPSRQRKQEEYDRVRAELQRKQREVVPLRGMDQKLVTAAGQIETFYGERLPGHSSAIAERLGKLADANHVQIASTRYETKEADVAGLRRVAIETTVNGDYLAVVRFINALERDPMFFILSGVQLAEQQGGTVRLALQLETYLKSESDAGRS